MDESLHRRSRTAHDRTAGRFACHSLYCGILARAYTCCRRVRQNALLPLCCPRDAPRRSPPSASRRSRGTDAGRGLPSGAYMQARRDGLAYLQARCPLPCNTPPVPRAAAEHGAVNLGLSAEGQYRAIGQTRYHRVSIPKGRMLTLDNPLLCNSSQFCLVCRLTLQPSSTPNIWLAYPPGQFLLCLLPPPSHL